MVSTLCSNFSHLYDGLGDVKRQQKLFVQHLTDNLGIIFVKMVHKLEKTHPYSIL